MHLTHIDWPEKDEKKYTTISNAHIMAQCPNMLTDGIQRAPAARPTFNHFEYAVRRRQALRAPRISRKTTKVIKLCLSASGQKRYQAAVYLEAYIIGV
jgi:hypothetical protein